MEQPPASLRQKLYSRSPLDGETSIARFDLNKGEQTAQAQTETYKQEPVEYSTPAALHVKRPRAPL